MIYNGTIKNVVAARGFGFVQMSGGPDVFFHMRDLVGLEFGENLVELPVQFELAQTGRGPRAENVRPVEITAAG